MMKLMEMPWSELRKWLRMWGPDIQRLADRGDQVAKKVIEIYRDCAYQNLPTTHPRHTDLRKALEDYLHRDLNKSDRAELGAKYGHLVDEEKGDRPTMIVVPGPGTKQ